MLHIREGASHHCWSETHSLIVSLLGMERCVCMQQRERERERERGREKQERARETREVMSVLYHEECSVFPKGK